MKKNILKMMLALVVTMMVITPIFAATTTQNKDTRISEIKKSGRLIVGLSADYPPYEFHQTINGQDKIVGFDVSLANEIADKLGVKLEVKEMAFDALLGALKTGKVNMVISGMSATPERANEVNFSKPYLQAQQEVLIRKADKNKYKNVNDFNNHKVTAQKGTTQADLATQELPGAKPVLLSKFTDAILELQTSKVDAIVVEEPVGAAYADHDKSLTMIPMNFKNKFGDGAAIALPKGADGLTAVVNNVIEKVTTDGTFTNWQKIAYKQMFVSKSFFSQYGNYFISGTGITLLLAVIGVFLGAILGVLLALMKRVKVAASTSGLSKLGKLIAKIFSNVYIEFVRGTPLMVQVYIIFFGATWLFHLNISAFASGALAVGLNSAAYVAEIIRSGINSVADGQSEAARSLGLSGNQAMRYVVLPQAVKNILPALGNEFVTVIKESSVVSVIGVGELMFKTSTVQGASFNPFLPLLITALIYFILTFGLTRILAQVEKRFNLK